MKYLKIGPYRVSLSQFAMLSLLFCFALAPEVVFAGTSGTEFGGVYTTFKNWAQGSLGKTISLAMFLVGLGAGIAQGSIMSVVVGIGSAIAFFYAPTIIEGIVTAVI